MNMPDIKEMFHEIVEYFFPERKSFWQKNKYYLIGGGLVVLVGAGFYGYHLYTTQRNTEAFGVLGRYIERYLKSDDTKKEGARLDDGALALESQSFAGSAASPYFSAYEAQMLLDQGKIAEAAPVLKKAIAAMPTSSPLTALYNVKLALVQMDAGDQVLRDEGLKSLKAIARNQSSPAWDVAVYYLGRNAWVNNDVNEAKKIWTDAITAVEKMNVSPVAKRYSESPWLERAKQIMKSII